MRRQQRTPQNNMESAYRQILFQRYGGPREPSGNASEFEPNYPMFKQLARSGASRYYGNLRGDQFGRVYVHTQEQIPLQELDEMRWDGQIRAGLTLYKLPIQRCKWEITGQDSDINNLITEILKPIWPETIRHILLFLDFGYMVAEKNLKNRYGLDVTSTLSGLGSTGKKRYPVVTMLEELMEIDPKTLKLLAYSRSGKFAGFEQFTPQTCQVPASKAFHVANEMEYRELYGVSRMKACYPYWIRKRAAYEWADIGYERDSLPVRMIRFPEIEIEDGEDNQGNPRYRSAQEIAIELGESLDNKNVIGIPSGIYSDSKTPFWDASFLQSPFKGQDLLAYIDHLDLRILKGLLIPELALNTGTSGSYDLAQEQIRMLMLQLEALMDQISQAVSTQIIWPLIKANCGETAPRAQLVFQPLADDVKEGLLNMLISAFGNNQPLPMKDGSAILPDYRKIAEDTGFPVEILEEEDMASYSKARDMVQPPQQMDENGNPVEGGAGGEGGGGDSPFGKPPGQGAPDRGGYGAKGGASKRPQNQQEPNPDDNEMGDPGMKLADIMKEWEVQSNELVWCPN